MVQYTVAIDSRQYSDFVTSSDGSTTVTIARINKFTWKPLPDTGSFWTIGLLTTGCVLAASGVYMSRRQHLRHRSKIILITASKT